LPSTFLSLPNVVEVQIRDITSSHVQDLLRLMGLPVIFARAEAEALCAQLNAAGHADACVTPDSDALLYGAETVIKELAVDLRKPVVDRYEASEIAQKMRLGRPHLVALALILGNDFDTKGVEGCGPKRAIKLVQGFSEDEVLDRWVGPKNTEHRPLSLFFVFPSLLPFLATTWNVI
jgi:5'-3' exonuclease